MPGDCAVQGCSSTQELDWLDAPGVPKIVVCAPHKAQIELEVAAYNESLMDFSTPNPEAPWRYVHLIDHEPELQRNGPSFEAPKPKARKAAKKAAKKAAAKPRIRR